MTKYFTKVSNELLPELRAGVWMPEGLRLLREVERRTDGFTLVEFEDDGAPAEMDGKTVTPAISSEQKDGKVVRTWVSDRYVERPA